MEFLRTGCDNVCLITTRAIEKGKQYSHIYASNMITGKVVLSSKNNAYMIPAYLLCDGY